MAIIIATITLTVLTILYHSIPARTIPSKKPRFVIFPKYHLTVDCFSVFDASLRALDFNKASQNKYVRGHALGNFVSGWLPLTVRYDPQTKTAVLGSFLFAIAFNASAICGRSPTRLKRHF